MTMEPEPEPEPEPAAAAVLDAKRRRGQALAKADRETLYKLLHPRFRWTSHRGVTVDRDTYIRNNTDGSLRWRAQTLDDVDVVIAGDTAVARCIVTDDVTRAGQIQQYRMPMTQTWVREHRQWLCLAGHAGPLL